ncbi:DNA polymerase beta superfamily protein [Anaerostipes sp. Marseille-Q3525]|uniref:DNA polymerase beta superfamily protein n=1 Tax=Anaerostipes sp. Marseille-Q3525 TaxID=2758418 RepID=UPI001BAA5295|nr:nucleotidyltransferase domain-containing protein [Anaerostipes sp. Marseille-Q3525]MBR9961900.1 nucleotidyltransferase domain-containing protein [Anaerostipes sp. Marseille-Q3525]
MTIEEVKDYINSSPEYDFLRDYPHKIAFLTLGGSYAYGTDTEDSDIDLRGVFLSDKREILLNNNPNNLEKTDDHKDVDTVLHSHIKMINMLAKGNPTFLELLYFAPDRYLYVSDIGMELIKNRDMFLSKRVYHSYKGYICDCLGHTNSKYYKVKNSPEIQRANKSMMHAIRLLLQGIQLLQLGTMCASDIAEEYLIKIRNGDAGEYHVYNYGKENEWREYRPHKYYIELIEGLLRQFEHDYKHTTLPNEPDWDRINDFLATTNERIVRGMV